MYLRGHERGLSSFLPFIAGILNVVNVQYSIKQTNVSSEEKKNLRVCFFCMQFSFYFELK